MVFWSCRATRFGLVLLPALVIGSCCIHLVNALALNIRPASQSVQGMAGWQNVATAIENLKIEDKNWNIVVTPADLPNDLEGIRACRIQAFVDEEGVEPKNMLNAQRNFISAKNAMTGRSLCLVAKERFYPYRILGTLDLRSQSNGSLLIQNVFVSPKARGQGLATRLVQEVERIAVESSDDKSEKRRRITLSVDTKNRPAVTLYQKCGYETRGINAMVRVLSRFTGIRMVMEMKKDLP